MSRNGRDLERLVAILEEALAPVGAHVKSPDLLRDKITGDLREVDVSVRLPSGLLAIGECRDREKPEDVTWVEQVATKAKDLGAHLAFMVSSSGFSSGAQRKAAAYRIELRELSALTIEEVQSWFRTNEVDLVERVHGLVGGEIELVGGDCTEFALPIQELLRKQSVDAPILERIGNPPVSLSGLWAEVLKRDRERIWQGAPSDGSLRRIRYHTTFQEPEKCFRVNTKHGPVPVSGVTLVADIQLKRSRIPISRITKYEGTKEELARNVEIDIPLGDDKGTISLHRLKETGKTAVRLRLPEKRTRSTANYGSSCQDAHR